MPLRLKQSTLKIPFSPEAIVHTLDSVSLSIFKNFPDLTPPQKDDILATLEEFVKNYGSDIFNEKLSLPFALRITGLKYTLARDILMDLTNENIHDIIALHPILEAQGPVFEKIDLLHEVRNSFPDYPETGLNENEEKKLVIKVADLNAENLTQLEQGKSIGEMFISNPKLFYYFY